MRITLELSETQTKVLQDALETALMSLVFQETQLTEALDEMLKHKTLENETDTEPRLLAIQRVSEFNGGVKAQRVLLAEILHTINEADKKTHIITR